MSHLSKILSSILFLLALTQTSALYAQHLYVANTPHPNIINDSKMHIYLCGTGVPQVSMQSIRKPACLALIGNKHFFLFDAGDGAIQTLASIGLPYIELQRIFMTHFHSDHMSGLGEAMNGTWHSGRTQPITLYGPYGVKDVLSGIKKAYRLDVLFRAIGGDGLLKPELAFANPVEISADQKGTEVYKDAGLKISAFAVDHLPVFPAFGYQINYKGCKIVISGDTRVNDSLALHAQKADLLLNEALSQPLYQESVAIDAKKNPAILAHAEQINSYHSNSIELAKMAQTAQVKKLVLTHLLPAIPTTDEAKKSFIAGMNDYYTGPITVGDDRDEIVLESNGSDCKITYIPAQPLHLQKEGG